MHIVTFTARLFTGVARGRGRKQCQEKFRFGCNKNKQFRIVNVPSGACQQPRYAAEE
jgi:hypothetical protein